MVLAFTCTPSKHAQFGLLNRTRTISEQQAENRKPCSPMPTDSANSYIIFTEINVLASVSWTEAWWYLLCVRGMSGTQAEMVFTSTFFFKKKQKLPNWFQSHIDNYFIKDKTHLFLSQNTNWLNRILNFYFINRHILATKCRKTQDTFFFLQFHTSKEANKFQCSAILG